VKIIERSRMHELLDMYEKASGKNKTRKICLFASA